MGIKNQIEYIFETFTINNILHGWKNNFGDSSIIT